MGVPWRLFELLWASLRALAQRHRELVVLAVALMLAMSTWSSTAAALSQLSVEWSLSDGQASWLTIVVQLGFVAGALVTALTNLADRIAPPLDQCARRARLASNAHHGFGFHVARGVDRRTSLRRWS